MWGRLFKSAAVAFFRSALALCALLMLRIVLSILSLVSNPNGGDDSLAVPITPTEIKIAVCLTLIVFLVSWRSAWRRLAEDPDQPL